jgi:hypothetical protein
VRLDLFSGTNVVFNVVPRTVHPMLSGFLLAEVGNLESHPW